jgi:hypothetical protein
MAIKHITFCYIHELVVTELDNWTLQLSWLERCTGIAGPQIRFLPGTSNCIFRNCSCLGLINVYKFTLDNFLLADPSTISLILF